MSNIDYITAHGFLSLGERDLLKRLAAMVPQDGIILNIGVEYGASLVCLRAGNPTAKIIGIDLDNSKCEVKGVADQLVTGNSQEIINDWDTRCNLIFIDGEHTFKGVISDLEFSDLSRVGDLVALHDCSDALTGKPHAICPEVNDAVEVWSKEHPEWTELQHTDSTRVFKLEGKKHEPPAAKRHSAHVQSPGRSK